MVSFVQPSFPTEHPGVVRIEAAVGALGAMRRRFDATRGLSLMLLAMMISALVVVADQLIDTWADGHLLAAWVAFWVVGFGAGAVFAGEARHWAATAASALDRWSQHVARARSDARLWAIAETDPRVMADLRAAILRSEQ